MRFRTRAIHVGNEPDPQTGAVVRPIHLVSTFVQPGAGDWSEFDYSRSGNPTRKAFETTLAALEGGVGALAFASGMAATHCAMMLLSSGDHVLAGADIYGGTYRLLHKVLDRAQIDVSLVSTSGDLAAVEAAITPKTKILWIESPGNPLMSITDIAACAKIAQAELPVKPEKFSHSTPLMRDRWHEWAGIACWRLPLRIEGRFFPLSHLWLFRAPGRDPRKGLRRLPALPKYESDRR